MNFVFLSTATHRSLPYQGAWTCGRWGRVCRPQGLFPLLSLHKEWPSEFKMIRYMQLYPTVTHVPIFSSAFSAQRMTIRIQNDTLHAAISHCHTCPHIPFLFKFTCLTYLVTNTRFVHTHFKSRGSNQYKWLNSHKYCTTIVKSTLIRMILHLLSSNTLKDFIKSSLQKCATKEAHSPTGRLIIICHTISSNMNMPYCY